MLPELVETAFVGDIFGVAEGVAVADGLLSIDGVGLGVCTIGVGVTAALLEACCN